jgi:CRP-like cAMP-binding protein/tRNA A-37 threonylcarbamoyl transferase component Bud32
MIAALMEKLQYTKEQCAIICQNMTKMELTAGTVLTDPSALYYVEKGSLKSADGVHMMMSSSLFGDVFGQSNVASQQTSSESGITASDISTVWTISRLLFQAVLIQATKQIEEKKTTFIAEIPILAPLSKQQQQRVSDVMKRVIFENGAKIITQGEIGNTMYFIESGKVTVYQSTRGEAEPKEINTHLVGAYFGETALLHPGENGGVRNADCIATSKTTCMALERSDVLRLLGPLQELMMIQSKARTLATVEILSKMSNNERVEIARTLERKVYKKGEKIIKEGNDGDEFFIVESGEVTFTKTKEGSSEVENIGVFFANQFFGEGSLLTNKPRRATATATTTDTICYVLSGKTFRQMFGSSIKTEMDSVLETRKQTDELSINPSSIKNIDLNAIQILGEGSYGKVTLVRHKISGKTFALKQITKQHVKKMKQEIHIQTEKDVLSSINHPFVCNLVRTYKNLHSVYFLMEAVLGGELYRQLKKVTKFSNQTSIFYCAQVVSVFAHIHSKNIIFRDLKPENLLIATDGYIKVVDFGLAKLVPNGKTYTLCGTPAYASPEVYASCGHDKGVDWWTLGVLLHELLAGYTPFYGNEPNQIHKEIKRYSKHYPKVGFPKHFSPEASALLLQLLHPKPSMRLGNLRGGARSVIMNEYFFDIDFTKLESKGYTPEFIPSVTDGFDVQNFKDVNDKFAKSIDDDVEGTLHESWAAGF